MGGLRWLRAEDRKLVVRGVSWEGRALVSPSQSPTQRDT